MARFGCLSTEVHFFNRAGVVDYLNHFLMNSNKHLFNTNELGKYRSILLKNLGFTVLRFENIREYQDPESVIKEIRKYQSEKQ